METGFVLSAEDDRSFEGQTTQTLSQSVVMWCLAGKYRTPFFLFFESALEEVPHNQYSCLVPPHQRCAASRRGTWVPEWVRLGWRLRRTREFTVQSAVRMRKLAENRGADVAAYGNEAVIFPWLVWKVRTGPENTVVFVSFHSDEKTNEIKVFFIPPPFVFCVCTHGIFHRLYLAFTCSTVQPIPTQSAIKGALRADITSATWQTDDNVILLLKAIEPYQSPRSTSLNRRHECVCASRGELLKKTDGLRCGGWVWGRWEMVDSGKGGKNAGLLQVCRETNSWLCVPPRQMRALLWWSCPINANGVEATARQNSQFITLCEGEQLGCASRSWQVASILWGKKVVATCGQFAAPRNILTCRITFDKTTSWDSL